MSTELILDSLQRRMRAMHSLDEDSCATTTVDQVNHLERDAVRARATAHGRRHDRDVTERS